MPKPPSLVEANGWNRRVADELGATCPRRGRSISIAASPPCSRAGDQHRRAGRAGVDRVLDEMGERLLEPRPDRRSPAMPGSPTISTGCDPLLRRAATARRPALDRDRRAAPRPRAPLPRRGGRAGRSSCSTELCSVAIMSARNSGLSACRSALRATRRQLADQILDVVHDEGEAAVELVEALRVGERLLAARLGEIARHLAAGDRGTGRNPPSRAARAPAGARARRGRPAGRSGAAARRPRRVDRRSAMPARRALASRASSAPPRSASRSTMCAVASRKRDERAVARRCRRGTSCAPVASARRARAGRARRARSSRPPGASVMSASALTMRSPSGAAAVVAGRGRCVR